MRKVFSILLAVLLVLALSSAAMAETIVTVSGSGETFVPADVAVISLGVSARDKEVLVAQAKVNESIAAIKEALIVAGVAEENINTDYINIYPIYNYNADMEELAAYNANSTLAVKVTKIAEVGKMIDTAFEAGANNLNGIEFSASDTSEAKAKALELAVEDAISKAEILARAAGMKIVGINSIQEGGVYSYDRGVGYITKNMEPSMDAAAGTVVQSAKLAVTANITVIFAVG